MNIFNCFFVFVICENSSFNVTHVDGAKWSYSLEGRDSSTCSVHYYLLRQLDLRDQVCDLAYTSSQA